MPEQVVARPLTDAFVRAMRARERHGWFRSGHRAATVALAFLVIVALAATFAQFVAPDNPNYVNLSNAFAPMSFQHLLGTDSSGRDLLSRIIFGARSTLLGSVLVVGIATVVGVSMAIAGAWFRGWVDALVGRCFDGLMVLPGLLLALTATAIFGAGLVSAGVALSLAYIPFIGRVTRSAALREAQQPYIAALRLQALPTRVLWLRHLMPNIAGLIVAQVTVNLGYAIIDMAAISYLGLGVQPPTADWGSMVASGQNSILQGYPAESLSAGIAIMLVVLAFNVLGDHLERRFYD